VPRADEHQGEYVPPSSARLPWLTGFTGSAGVAAVLSKSAALFIDGRYTLQVVQETEPGLWAYRHLVNEPLTDWLASSLSPGERLGYDPWLHSTDEVARIKLAVEKAGATLEALDANPLDAVWPDRPAPPLAPVVPHPLAYAGENAADKRERIAADLAKDGVDAAVIAAPDAVAWLLNIRGGDVEHSPLPLSFAILRADATVDLFIDRRKLTAGLDVHLGNAVAIREPDALGPALDAFGAEKKTVQVDPTGAYWLYRRLEISGAKPKRAADPCALPRALKNATEIAGARAAHRRDGVAMARFLAWLDDAAPGGTVDELGAAERLGDLRRENDLFRDFSFTTISGAGPNGAIVHYRSSPATNRRLEPGSFYLVDSGAQYLDATTDITRTVAVGAPNEEMRDRYTRVLKGHIALARCRFPRGTSGSQLDAFARHALWQAGLDFDHGTGHGVGSYLSVHEGPHRISKLPSAVALQPGMIVSNEPGYYKTGAYGIRIENLVLVVEAPPIPGGERPMLAFETLTRCPIDRRGIELRLMTGEEIAWIDAYHAAVRADLAAALDAKTRIWLERATAPLGTG
jgi:Xaa-Pro aminopeptidase